MSGTLSDWLQAARPRTLPASLAPILLGNWLAFIDKPFSVAIAVLTLLCALALQVLVNFANDYFDHQRGVDTDQRLGPQRVTQAGIISPRAMIKAMRLAALSAVVSGVLLVWLSSLWLLPLGALSIAGAYLYSGGPRPLASMGLGEVTVFLFFGLVAVAGSYFAQTGMISSQAWLGAVVVGLPVSAIMLVNNLRDIPTDAIAGKRTLAVRLGEARSRGVYSLLLLLPAGLIVAPLQSPTLVSGVLGAITLAASLILIRKLATTRGSALNSLLGQTANLSVWFAVAFALAV